MPQHNLIFEFKKADVTSGMEMEKAARAAINQIRDRRYAKDPEGPDVLEVLNQAKETLMVGIGFSGKLFKAMMER